MDKFTLLIGLIGFTLIIISIYIFISTLIRVIKRKEQIKNLFTSIFSLAILILISTIFLLLFSLLQTFSRFSYEEKIGEIYTSKIDNQIHIIFNDIKKNKNYEFYLNGDQWMIEGEILVFDKSLRWLGAESYYRISRFSGRFEENLNEIPIIYEINKKSRFWEFLLKNYEKIPFVDTAYGIAAFQYPNFNFEIFVNDTGFILRKK